MKIELDGLPEINSAKHMHWRTKQKIDTGWKLRVRSAVHAYARNRPQTKPFTFAKIVYTRKSSAQPDHDNLVHSFKALQDALIGLVIIDDGPDYITTDHKWEQAPPNNGSVTIEVEEVIDVS